MKVTTDIKTHGTRPVETGDLCTVPEGHHYLDYSPFLVTYNNIVALRRPKHTWTRASMFEGDLVPLPPGSKVTLEQE